MQRRSLRIRSSHAPRVTGLLPAQNKTGLPECATDDWSSRMITWDTSYADTMSPRSPVPADYPQFLEGIKERIRTEQVRASLSVNRVLVLLYWSIGRDILRRQEAAEWGAKLLSEKGTIMIHDWHKRSGKKPRIWLENN